MAVRSTKIAAVLALALTAGLAASAQGPLSSAVIQEAWPVHGLAAPAEIIVDHWGIPHIFAQNTRDAFFLQGYNAARDRLWQIDLWRKRGLGRLSASFGPAYVAQDKAARLFLYRGDMAAEWAAYGPSARTRAEAFAGLAEGAFVHVLINEYRLVTVEPKARKFLEGEMEKFFFGEGASKIDNFVAPAK